MPRASVASELSAEEASHRVASLTVAKGRLNPGLSTKSDNRVTSITSIDSNIHCQWPGPRVFSNQLEWKSASSVAQAAGLASGCFANTQGDGTSLQFLRSVKNKQELADMQTKIAGARAQRSEQAASKPSDADSRPLQRVLTRRHHQLAKLATWSSVHLASRVSLPVLPRDSPTKDKKKDSPGKNVSPAKVKFENLAEKVGIKVTGGKKESGSPDTPPSKRRWRDVWRGGSRKEASKGRD